jgi:pimeloyl-ACP methyl ester carboxylesterase
MTKHVERAVNAIIRPPRKQYDPITLPLFLQGADDRLYVRHPVNIQNHRSQRICGSLYVSADRDLMDGGPCVVYMHGNASSQHEGQFLIPNLCPYGIVLYCFDFAGCGASGGEFISLGHFETIDVEFLLENLEMSFGLGPFVLWGRSMGAATSFLVNSPQVVGRIADSPFSSIPDVCTAISRKLGVPAVFVPAALLFLKITVHGRADFDLSSVSPLEAAQKPTTIPLLMCHAEDDEFIPLSQSQALMRAYRNRNKKLIVCHGGHNGRRSLGWIEEACQFAFGLLQVEAPDFKPRRPIGIHQPDEHFRSYEDLLAFANNRSRRSSEAESPLIENPTPRASTHAN